MKALKAQTNRESTVCSCSHSQSSAWVWSMHCVWYTWDYIEKWQNCTTPICM